MATKAVVKKVSTKKIVEVEEDYSLNDVLLRGRVSQEAVEKELPSGDKVVEFRLIVTRQAARGRHVGYRFLECKVTPDSVITCSR